MLQVRIINPNTPGDTTILGTANNVTYFKSVSSSDEGIAFEIAKSDSKADILDPYDQASFTNIWEVWDTATNTRLNLGPITGIEDSGGVYKVTGAGRSALLGDYFQSIKTFYGRIDSIVEEMRYENVATSPSTTVLVTTMDIEDEGDGSVLPSTFVEEFYALSKRSKDFAIDGQNTYIPFNKIEPTRGFSTTSEYWSGMSDNDSLLLDFGDTYDISRVRLMFPWWGGPQRANNRSYDFAVASIKEDSPLYTVQDRPMASPFDFFNTFDLFEYAGSRLVTKPGNPVELYIGTSASGYGTGLNTFYTKLDQAGPLSMRYMSVNIFGVHAWFGTDYDTQASHDGYAYQCDPNYRPHDDSYFGSKLGLMTSRNKAGTIIEKKFSDQKLTPANDCHASIIELGAYQEIIPKGTIKPLALQRIDNNSKQISYSHDASGDPMKNTAIGAGVHARKYEPGSFFKKFKMTWSGANSSYTKFFPTDCSNCYPDGFNFQVVDDDNNAVISTDSSSGAGSTVYSARSKTKHLLARGTATVQVTWIDAWLGKTDPLSWGGSHSYSEIEDDYFSVHFRGESFKWYATVPSTKTGATVKIEIRQKANQSIKHFWFPEVGPPSVWGAWTTLEASFQLPNNISAFPVYEIPYGSGILEPDITYEIRVTMLDTGYCSVDSIEGYWTGSMTEYNEDSTRITMSDPQKVKQIYDKRFSGGSMYKWNTPGVSASLSFEGDRIIIYSARGRHHGQLNVLIREYSQGITDFDSGIDDHIMIPGGNADGSKTINLDTGKRGAELPNAVLFDSDTSFPDGLPWGRYTVTVIYPKSVAVKYSTTKNETGSNSFVRRCQQCNPSTATTTSIYEYVYLDSIEVHERVGLSVNFEDETHLDILKSIAEAIQVEWDASTDGLYLEPRLGRDTDIALREGENTLVSYSITNDLSKVATTLISNGSDIDGLPLSALVEDKKSKRLFGRTITRRADFRDVADYTQLIGLGRTELRRRNRPEKRITVAHVAPNLGLVRGDSFILWTKKSGSMRLRINRIEISESSGSGRQYTMECIEWPQIV